MLDDLPFAHGSRLFSFHLSQPTKHSELLELLLQHNADLKVRMRGSGHTPLMLASMKGDRVREYLHSACSSLMSLLLACAHTLSPSHTQTHTLTRTLYTLHTHICMYTNRRCCRRCSGTGWT